MESSQHEGKIWISFDLGVRGDYESLFAWLDDHGAKECGVNAAYVEYVYEKDFVPELKAELDELMGKSSRNRVYVIHTVGKEKGAKGQWIIGGRKAAPWVGFGAGSGQEVDQ